jgi:molecular chaperone GrpE
VERDNQRIRLWERADLLIALLPCLDDFDRARESENPENGTFDREGILIIMDRLADVLKKEGLTEVEASPGEVFDPEIHEAVLTVPSAEVPEGCVAQILEKGYRIGERLLRAAKVAVARAPDAEPATQGD